MKSSFGFPTQIYTTAHNSDINASCRGYGLSPRGQLAAGSGGHGEGISTAAAMTVFGEFHVKNTPLTRVPTGENFLKMSRRPIIHSRIRSSG